MSYAPNLQLHLTRLSCSVAELAGPAAEICPGGSSPAPPLPLSSGVGRVVGENLSENEPYTQLQMVWPEHLLDAPPPVRLPSGYTLRTYQPGDEPRFYEVMALAGWPGWDAEKPHPWLLRVVPEGWFMVVCEGTGEIVTTAMALHDHLWSQPFSGELGWLAGDPAHAGKGLGGVVSAAVTGRFVEIGYRNIHLYTEHWRWAALKTYLKLGYLPLLCAPDMAERWQVICAQLEWPFRPEAWKP